MKIFIYLLLVFLLTSCGVLAPFRERSETVKNIAKAKAVEAAKYAYEDFNQSKTLLEKADTLIVSNKKSPANKKAKEILDEAILLSQKSYSNAIKLHVNSILKITDETIEEAIENKANVAFEDEFSNIFQNHSKNKSFYEEEKYEETLSTISNISEQAISLNKKTVELKNLAIEQNIKAFELASNATVLKVHIAMSNEYKIARKNLDFSEEAIGRGKYYDAINILKGFTEEINKFIQITGQKKKSSIISYTEADSKLGDFKKTHKTKKKESLKNENLPKTESNNINDGKE